MTTLSGELLQGVTQHTIPADSLQGKFLSPNEYLPDQLFEGYRLAQREGVTRALFSIRIGSQFVDFSPVAARNFVLGVLLQSDIQAIQNSDFLKGQSFSRIAVAGKEPWTRALCDLLQESYPEKQVERYVSPTERPLSCEEALKLWKIRQGEKNA